MGREQRLTSQTTTLHVDKVLVRWRVIMHRNREVITTGRHLGIRQLT